MDGFILQFVWVGVTVLFLAGLTHSPGTRRVALVALIVTAVIGVLVVTQNSLLDSLHVPVISTILLLVIWAIYLIARWRAWPERLQRASRVVLLVAVVLYIIWLGISVTTIYD